MVSVVNIVTWRGLAALLRLMSSAVFIRPGYCGVTWYIPRTLQRTRKPLCFQHTWYRFYDELEKGACRLAEKGLESVCPSL